MIIQAYYSGKLDKEEIKKNVPLITEALEEQDLKYKGITIFKRSDGRYTAKPSFDGKQYSIYGKTQSICLENLKEFFKNKPIKKDVKKSITFYEWIQKWYDTYKVGKLKDKSLYEIRLCINKHIKSHLSDRPLNKLTAIDCDIALNKIESSRMRKYTYDCYCDCLRHAYRSKLIKDNLSELITPIHHTRVKGLSLTTEQRIIFLKKVKEVKYGEIFLFQFYSGARPQGARNLKWSYINEEKNIIYINETKSKNGQRYIPYFKQLKNLLSTIPRTDERVFPISYETIKTKFDELRDLCGFEFTQKSLRHTFGTMCGENGISDITIAKWMGHGNPSTTKKYYIDILSDFEKQQAKKMEENYPF